MAAQIRSNGDGGRQKVKELENENSELKKMLADEMLKARVLEEALKKKY
jgi:hypothetical protein